LADKTNYYKMLGVDEQADEEQLKSAYRKLAFKYHPDRNPDDKAAEDTFKQLTEAYRILSDPRKRSEYDRRQAPSGQGSTASSAYQSQRTNVNDVFDMFDNFSSGKTNSRQKYQHQARGSDLKYDLSVSFEDAVLGTTAALEVTRLEQCSRCHGTSIEPRAYPMLCPVCLGKGRIRQSHGFLGFTQVCQECNGSGRVYQKECSQCRGESRLLQRRKISVNIPPNVHDGMSLKVAGEGESGLYGGLPGDLFITLHVQPHEFFGRKDHDIWCEVPLSVTQAILGGIIEVPTLEGKVRIRIPAGTQHERVFRLSKKGIPTSADGQRGDLFVKMKVAIPTAISPRQRQLLEEFARLNGETVKRAMPGFMRQPRAALVGWWRRLLGNQPETAKEELPGEE